MRRMVNRNANWNAVSRGKINGSFLDDHLPVTRDCTVFAEIEFMTALRCTMKIESVFYCLAPSPTTTKGAQNRGWA